MAMEQSLIQIRVDTKLKGHVTEIFDKIGIDIPTAVRMFFKATVREQGLPFGTNVADQVSQDIAHDEAENLMHFFKNLVMYEPPITAVEDNVIAVLPLEYGREIPVAMYAQLVTKIPEGRISCWEDINDFLGKLYGKEVHELPSRPLLRCDTNNKPLPYWRIVSKRGVLGNRMTGSPDNQRDYLMKEGLEIVQRGSIEGSYRVLNYKERMFHFEDLRVIRT